MHPKWITALFVLCLICAGCESEVAKPSAINANASSDVPEVSAGESDATSSTVETSELARVAHAPQVEEPLVALRDWPQLISEREFPVIPETNVLRVSFDDLNLKKILGMDKVPADATLYFPDWLRQLEGKRIRMTGYMDPPPEETGNSEFFLEGTLRLTNFGAPIRVDESVLVELQKNTTTDYLNNKKVDVEGVFKISPLVDKGEMFQLYLIEDARVILD